MFLVLLSAMAHISNTLLDKVLLGYQKLALKQYIPVLFAFLFLFSLLASLVPGLASYDPILIGDRQYLFFMILMLVLAIVWNILYYEGLQKAKLVEFELIIMLAPLATMLLSALFFPEELELPILGAAIVGGAAVFLTQMKSHHLKFSHYTANLMMAVVVMSLEAMVQRELLNLFSPVLLYTIRTAVLAAFFAYYFRPDLTKIKAEQFNLVIASALLGAIYFIARLYGFANLGITLTTLVLLLVPVAVSLVETRITGTPVKKRTLFAFVIVLACVIYSAWYQGL